MMNSKPRTIPEIKQRIINSHGDSVVEIDSVTHLPEPLNLMLIKYSVGRLRTYVNIYRKVSDTEWEYYHAV